jgi:hypothetical protein
LFSNLYLKFVSTNGIGRVRFRPSWGSNIS